MIALLLAMAGAQEVQGFAELRATAAIGADGPPFQLVERFRPTFEAPARGLKEIGRAHV